VDEPRTHTGWKAALLAIALTFVVFALLNLLGRATRPTPKRVPPPPIVVSVAPSG
jgi:antibiotic biosynthesis monooxygenase (ABM) superfamily enzyme